MAVLCHMSDLGGTKKMIFHKVLSFFKIARIT